MGETALIEGNRRGGAGGGVGAPASLNLHLNLRFSLNFHRSLPRIPLHASDDMMGKNSFIVSSFFLQTAFAPCSVSPG